MNKFLVLLALFSPLSFAQAVPYCWQADQPNIVIQEGIFRVYIPTAGTSALNVAEGLGILSQALATQVGVGTSITLDRIEIDMYGELKYWEPTAVFKTLQDFKTAIVKTIAPVLLIPGVKIECALVSHRS
jgi:hypothetical protein